ncbi:serine/threonine-protein kinase [Amycolatopsis sp. SID8362]|uniref:serine/threonine-protein kinase n=1 Tax=Amycolatopsis sp. SID8362 TaxID=2690346 RepID=UPI00136F496A|nr:serine/threonine-protein kinase [Amycolatopsis sp. SID8362]NBH06794.1 protein kinase [Amycolatopsis sp. SID8362]NED43491.1 serine/threonine protein kinase [Amycolatopsis sp. SID8362]
MRELLGEGTSGEVYRVEDGESGQRLALKIQRPRFLESTAWYRESFDEIHHEVSTGEKLSTVPGLIQAQRSGDHAGRAYYVMPDVGGHDLVSFAEREGAVSSLRTAAIVVQLCAVVGRLHAQGWVHRDIKLENALIDPDGQVWLIDLGSAVQPGAEAGPAGTPGYTAPEIGRGAAASIASDVFSLGCVLFKLAVMNLPYPNDTGRRPAPGPPFREELRPALDALAPGLRAVGSRMIAWDPGDRPPSADAVAEELTGLLPGVAAPPRRGREPDPVLRYWLAKYRNDAYASVSSSSTRSRPASSPRSR